ncbi:RAI1-domain-containing protein [Martensiomyces pterosporus]|nr:RAI1-domain-containing protein [Martensiomyces pterosporus]
MYRGMLTRIFVTPYNTRDSWAMNATRVGNTIYIEDNVTPEAIAGRMSSSEKHQMLMYSGYKFETLCVIDKPPSQLDGSSDPALASRLDTIVDTHSEYCSVFRTRLGSHSIISGAEVDCIDREKPHEFPNRYYRELKTTGLLDSPRKVEMFERHKLIKFWAQSFIAGIPRVTVGYRDSDGTLRQIEEINTMEMPRRVRNKPRMWEASVCMNFADMVLQKIKDCVVDEGPETQYRISFDSASQEIEIAPLGKCKPFMTKEYIAVASAKK